MYILGAILSGILATILVTLYYLHKKECFHKEYNRSYNRPDSCSFGFLTFFGLLFIIAACILSWVFLILISTAYSTYYIYNNSNKPKKDIQ